jgi:hypothetical protein
VEIYAFAAVLGLLTACAVAIGWAAIAVAAGMRIGYMAIGAAFAIAFVVRHSVDRVDSSTGVLSAALALVKCVLGNFLTACALFSRDTGAPPMDGVLRLLPHSEDLRTRTFRPIDLVYYGIGVYAGYRYGRKPMKAGAPVRQRAADGMTCGWARASGLRTVK